VVHHNLERWYVPPNAVGFKVCAANKHPSAGRRDNDPRSEMTGGVVPERAFVTTGEEFFE